MKDCNSTCKLLGLVRLPWVDKLKRPWPTRREDEAREIRMFKPEQRLKLAGALEVKRAAGDWYGLFPCVRCGIPHWIREEYRLRSRGKCLKCAGIAALPFLNSPARIRPSGKNHPNHKRGYTVCNGYKILWISDKHPLRPIANRHNKLGMQRAVMAKHLGRLLLPKERVYFLNGDSMDTRLKNLSLEKPSLK